MRTPPRAAALLPCSTKMARCCKDSCRGQQTRLALGAGPGPAGFGEFGGDLLVGNFSFDASEINAFDPMTGAYEGTIPIDPGPGNTRAVYGG